MFSADWSYPTQIRFGAGRLSELGAACRAIGLSNPLLITDPAIAAMEMTARARLSLEQAGYSPALFAEVRPDPDEANLEAGLAAFRSGGHDGVVALGGGSALDLGKTVAFMAGQALPVWDFEDIGDNWKRADVAAMRPVVAIPTTAGTGSEASRATVITHAATNTKKIIYHPKLTPTLAILDPELTLGLPPGLTAATGMDALTHNIEAFCGKYPHPMADGIAMEGARLISENLPKAFADGSDVEARGYMLIGSMMGAVAFQRGLGAVHALSHPIGALHHIHHGLINGVLMPYVFAWNRPEIEDKIAALAHRLGIAGGFDGFQDWLVALRAELAIPPTLGALGVGQSDFPRIAAMSLLDPTAAVNPRPYSLEGAMAILEAAA